MCKKAAATFSNLDYERKQGKMENRSLNSRLAVMSLLGGWEPDAEGQVLGLDLILWVFVGG